MRLKFQIDFGLGALGAAFITALQDGAALAHAAQHVAAEALTPLLTQLIQAALVLGVTDITKTQEATNVSHT